MGLGTYALKSFLEALGVDVVLPPSSSRRTLELGVRYSPELVCLPFKITLGNFIEALERGVPDLFMAAGPRRCRFGYYHIVQERILRDLGFRFKMHSLDQYEPASFALDFLPRIFSVSRARVVKGVRLLLSKARLIEEYERRLRWARAIDFVRAEAGRRSFEPAIKRAASEADIQATRRALRVEFPIDNEEKPLTVGMTGEIYLMLDDFANREIEKELGRLGALVRSNRSFFGYLRRLLHVDFEGTRSHRRAHAYLSESPGGEAEKTVGEAAGFCSDGVDGLIHLFPFTCMPENIAGEAISQIGARYDRPVLTLSLDEHTAQAGLTTRLEAFVDLVRRRRDARLSRR